MAHVWPSTLPQVVEQDSYSESGGVMIGSSQPDDGLAITEWRGKLPTRLENTYLMTTAQFTIFLTFVETTIKGVAPFEIPNPDALLGGTLLVRLIPQDKGRVWSRSPLGYNLWEVRVTLEVMP